MSIKIHVAGYAFESISAAIHQRAEATLIDVEVGISDVETGLVELPKSETTGFVYAVQYRHFVSGKTKDGQPFYDAETVVKAFFVSKTSIELKFDGPSDFMDAALSMAMPVSSQKLRELCATLGISPVPTISSYPKSIKIAPTNDEDSNDEP